MNATKENDYTICETCKWFSSGIHDCEIHPEYGFMLEEDTCDDWTDPAELWKILKLLWKGGEPK